MTVGFQICVKEKYFMIKLFSVALLTAASLAGQAAPICSVVTVDDARALIGPTAKRTNDPSGCVWREANGKKRMNVAKVGSFAAFESYRAHSAREGKTQTENGLGGTGFSSIPTDGDGSRAAIYLMKGPVILVVDIDGFAPGGAEERLPQVRDLVRKLVPKL
jgi:hypothetical protein